MMTFPVENISVSIERPAAEVYEFISNPLNLPKWATGLSGTIDQIDGKWIAESPMGRVEIEFVEKNKYGIADHSVTTSSGEKFYNPMRVLPNRDGCEVIFTLFHLPASSDEKFLEDIKWVENDLSQLKQILEKTH